MAITPTTLTSLILFDLNAYWSPAQAGDLLYYALFVKEAYDFGG